MNWLSCLTVFTLKFLIYKIRSQSNDLLSVSSCDSFFFKSKHGPIFQDQRNLSSGMLVNSPEWLCSHVSQGFCCLPGTRRTAQPPHPSLLPWFLYCTVSFQSGSHAYPTASARALSRLRTFLLWWLQFSSVQSLSHVWLFVTPWITARQASLSITNSQSSLKLTSIESVMPSSHLIFCRPLLLLPPIPPSIRVFSNESTLCMRWPKYWIFSFSTSTSSEHPGLFSFRMD